MAYTIRKKLSPGISGTEPSSLARVETVSGLSDGDQGDSTFPWVIVGTGAALFGMWYLARRGRDTMISNAIESGEMEDCGCGG